jgi:hypothetical protein
MSKKPKEWCGQHPDFAYYLKHLQDIKAQEKANQNIAKNQNARNRIAVETARVRGK